jgi:hypothetical protein
LSATGVVGVSKSVGSDGKITYSDALSAPPSIQNGRLVQGVAQSDNAPPSIQNGKLLQGVSPMSPNNDLYGYGAMNPSVAGTSSARGGSTPQERYALQQQQEQAQAQSQSVLPPRYQQNQVTSIASASLPAMQEAIMNNIAAGQKDMSIGANRIQAKYAHQQLDTLLGKDTADMGSQHKTNEQMQQASQFNDTMANKKQQDLQDNYARLLETQQKAPYYQSEAALNNERVRQLQLPAQPTPEKWTNTHDAAGKPIQVSNQGVMRSLNKDPATMMLDDYRKSAELLSSKYDPESDAYAAKMNELENDPQTKQLRKLGLI